MVGGPAQTLRSWHTGQRCAIVNVDLPGSCGRGASCDRRITMRYCVHMQCGSRCFQQLRHAQQLLRVGLRGHREPASSARGHAWPAVALDVRRWRAVLAARVSPDHSPPTQCMAPIPHPGCAVQQAAPDADRSGSALYDLVFNEGSSTTVAAHMAWRTVRRALGAGQAFLGAPPAAARLWVRRQRTRAVVGAPPAPALLWGCCCRCSSRETLW
jgi:hypothetical protein